MEIRKQSFIRGTFVLIASAFVTRALGFVNGIMLARFLGEEGIGLLMIAHPLLPLFITVTELGLPAAISKLVSEAETKGDSARVRRILVVSLSITGILSVILTLFALLGSKWIASVFLPDQRAYYAMLAITPIIPIVAITAVLKGYFRGKQNMNPLALSDIIENVMQIAVVIGIVHWLLPYGVEYAAAGAMVSAVAGEGAGLLYLLATFRWTRGSGTYAGINGGMGGKAVDRTGGRGGSMTGGGTIVRASDERSDGTGRRMSGPISGEKGGSVPPSPPREGLRTLRDLLGIGLPLTGSGLIHSVFHALLPMLVVQSLLMSGTASAAEATKQFGLLMGYAFPLLVLPSFFTQSLSTALIPAISEAAVNRDKRLMHQRMNTAMRFALFAGVPCSIVLYIWAVPLATVIYHAPAAGDLLQRLVPFFFLYYFQAPLHAILLGLGKASTVMWNLIATNLFQVAAIVVFGSKFGIQGVACALGLSICLLTILHLLATSDAIGFFFDIRTVIRAGFAAIVMTICGTAAYSFLQHSGAGLAASVSGAVFFSLLAYAATLRVIRAFHADPGIPAIK